MLCQEQHGSFDDKGRAFTWRMTTDWVPAHYGVEVRCGRTAHMTLSMTSGVSRSLVETVKGFANANLGVKDLAGIQAGVERTSQSGVSWSYEKSFTTTLDLQAPRCGSEMHLVYQLRRTFALSTVRKRLFRSPLRVEFPKIIELTGIYRTTTERDDGDPECPCDHRPPSWPRTPFTFRLGRLYATLGVTETRDGIAFQLGDKTFELAGRNYDSSRPAFAPGLADELPIFFWVLSGLERGTGTADVTLWRDDAKPSDGMRAVAVAGEPTQTLALSETTMA